MTDSETAKWTVGNNDDSEVEKIAQWVVDQINEKLIKENKLGLVKEIFELVEVLAVQIKFLYGIGTLYRLLLELKDQFGQHKRCEALVLVKTNGEMVLWEIYFGDFHLKIIGGWTDAGNDVGIEDMAKFAVDEYNKKEGTTLEFTKLKKAEKQLVAGILYRLTLEAIDDGHKNLYQAMVIVIPWEKIKQLEDFKPLLLNAED